MSFILQPKVLARLFCRFRAISINGLDRSQFNQRPGSNQRPLGPGWRNSTITPKIRNSGKLIQPIWFISLLLVIQIRKPNILAATRSIMFCDVFAISLAVPAISWANWPMAFFEHYLCMPYVSFSRPENQNPARRHHLAQIAKSPILRFNYG